MGTSCAHSSPKLLEYGIELVEGYCARDCGDNASFNQKKRAAGAAPFFSDAVRDPVSPGSPMLLRFWAKVCLGPDVYPTTRWWSWVGFVIYLRQRSPGGG